MHLGLEKKVVLVTGGTKGIGRTIVRHFLAEGATVHFCSRTATDVDSTTKSLTTDFPDSKAVGSVVDISNLDQLTSWTHTAASTSGIDVVIANVSALSIPDTPASWHSAFQTDLLALHTLLQTALPYLEKSRGNIISVASVSGRDIDFTTPGPYGPAKAAVIHYTASLARAWAPKGVRANCVSPGNIYIEDGVWGGIERENPELFRRQMAANPMGRMGRPEEVADAVAFLASQKAGFVSGANFVVDGALCQGVQF